MRGDGNGWVHCGQGHRHWGRYGAAGLLLYAVDPARGAVVLLQHRADWTHNGGTWGIPGGAKDSHEDAPAAALREATEETAIDVTAVSVGEVSCDDHGFWSYETVLAHTPRPLRTAPNDESNDLVWHRIVDVGTLDLHPGFARTWPRLAAQPVVLHADAASGRAYDALSRVLRTATGRLVVVVDIVAGKATSAAVEQSPVGDVQPADEA